MSLFQGRWVFQTVAQKIKVKFYKKMRLGLDSVNKCAVGILAGSLGHWDVNKESKMVEMLLRSC